jgi:hypothetical protein
MSSGLAYAADGAKPGDLMYGLDRAFEAVGLEFVALRAHVHRRAHLRM